MEKCLACGKTALMPERIGNITICKTCSLKIQAPIWKNKNYPDIDTLRQQKEKSLY